MSNNIIILSDWVNSHQLIFALLIIWTLAIKGTALWKAAGLKQKYWFAALLIVNTLGLLELFYIFVIARKKDGPQLN